MEGRTDPPADPSAARAMRWAFLPEELQRLRTRAGSPSYAAIAQLLHDRRVGRGADEYAARVPRSTVHDYFTTVRARPNLALVREMATALGGTDEAVDAWVARGTGVAVDLPRAADVASPDAAPGEPGTDEPPPHVEGPVVEPRPTWPVVALLLACVAVNLLGRVLVDSLTLPVYLDMLGTAVAASALGPWRGAAVGVGTNVLGVLSSGPASLAFIPVNVVGALVWGYGVRRYGMGRTLQRFFVLDVVAALACSLVAVPILYVGFGGFNGNGSDTIARTVDALTGVDLLGVAVANVLVSLGDKLISGFAALVAVASLPPSLRRGTDLVLVPDAD